MSEHRRRVVCWFSAGAASAVATMLTIRHRLPGDVVEVCRIHLDDEDADNARFADDCAAWFGQSIRVLRSDEYASAEDVWTKRRYMAGPQGAACTAPMKKAPRWAFEREWQPDAQVFGFTADLREVDRAARFREQNPEVNLRTPLIDESLTKADCFAIIQRAGLVLPLSYRQGYDNANCIGCVKAQSPNYWNRVRRTHPAVFARRAALSRELGVALVKATTGARERVFLDELSHDDLSDDGAPNWDCSIACAIAESRIGEAT